MTTHLVFSDDSGQYSKKKSNRFLKRNPYYIRSWIITDAKEWRSLASRVKEHKFVHGIPNGYELKFCDIYHWENCKRKMLKEYPDLSKITQNDVLQYIQAVLTTLTETPDTRLIFTVTWNHNILLIKEKDLVRMHMEDAILRVEMQIREDDSNLAVFFMDSEKTNVDDRRFMDFFSKYLDDCKLANCNHIMPTPAMADSRYNLGLQLADYCAGVVNNALQGRPFSMKMFRIIYPAIIKDSRGRMMGWGVKEVPTDRTKTIREMIEEVLLRCIH